ncbi:hypothetical protein [Liquorilactobacillus phage UCMA21115]|uniref:Uncharacterized protein n=1 Tax=Leuconostoc phage phiLNTR3 TaxID=1262521 RepID=A0A059PAT0_9CAUD|nr:hypothetical protein HL53_gp37 [Leuconostoc phage phiLNTR3]AFY98530.1 hypothetical protein phiLNTR3_037 [Leuconostoc phage phiLNTR3]UPW35766.1 hypothetical protein [Liquorilactobacillus phage UCMA21115]
MNILVSTILVIVLVFSMLLVWGLVSALATNINVKTLEKRRSVMLDIVEEEIITQAETQPDKVNAPDIVIQLNRRMNIKKFTQTDILHMTITTLKSLKLKGVL